MSELKSYDLVDIQDYRGEVYLKSEADKVIERKDKAFKYAQAVILIDIEIIKKQKRKRCLAMAKWCAAEYDIYNLTPRIEKVELYRKWRKRWLELAEKFKEAK